MHEVPVVGESVLARVLAHRRDDDAVGESQRTKGQRIEEVRHRDYCVTRRLVNGCVKPESTLPIQRNEASTTWHCSYENAAGAPASLRYCSSAACCPGPTSRPPNSTRLASGWSSPRLWFRW